VPYDERGGGGVRGWDWWLIRVWLACAAFCIGVWYGVWLLAHWALGRMMP